jgi:hypothetical protein
MTKQEKKKEKILKGDAWNRLVSYRGKPEELSNDEKVVKAGFDPRFSFRKAKTK